MWPPNPSKSYDRYYQIFLNKLSQRRNASRGTKPEGRSPCRGDVERLLDKADASLLATRRKATQGENLILHNPSADPAFKFTMACKNNKIKERRSRRVSTRRLYLRVSRGKSHANRRDRSGLHMVLLWPLQPRHIQYCSAKIIDFRSELSGRQEKLRVVLLGSTFLPRCLAFTRYLKGVHD
jgi:hypothetical protein